MNAEKLDRLKSIKAENFIWIIYIGIIILSWYANSFEKNFILYDDENARENYQELLILIFSILFIVYLYFTVDSYKDLNNSSMNISNKAKNLKELSFIGSLLILISGAIFLYIATVDDNIDTEIAFN